MVKILAHFKKFDWVLLFSAISLTLIGLVSIYSSSRGNFLNFQKQLIFLGLGISLAILTSFFDWRTLRENSFLIFGIYFLSFFLLVGLYFFAPKIREVRAWYKIGPIFFEPSEMAKFSLLIFLSKYFSIYHTDLYDLRHIFISFLFFLFLGILIFFQPDLGSFLILFLLWLGVLFFSGIKIRQFLLILILFSLIFVFSFEKILKPYQKERILTFLKLKPADPLGTGWSQTQAKIAIGSGGFFGKGIKKGSQVQLGFLPVPQTDFIFAAIGEEMGGIGILLLLIFYSILFFQILKISFSVNSNFARIFGSGFLAILFFQILFHSGSNLGFLPVIGIPLPFVSYGGSSLIFNFLAIGILESIKVHG